MTDAPTVVEVPKQRKPQTDIKDVKKFLGSMRNFASWLGDAAPGASDLDCILERKGHILVFENKTWAHGISVPLGQYLMLKTLSEVPGFTVTFIGEDDETPDAVWTLLDPKQKPVYTKRNGRVWMYYPADRFQSEPKSALQDRVRAWMAYATANPIKRT